MTATDANWLSTLTPAHVQNLDVYQPGKPIEELERELGISGAIKVASNENPLGPSSAALAAIAKALPNLHLYPDAGGFALRRALAAKWNCSIEQISLGAGSNELLYQLVLATCDPADVVVSHEFGFLSYRLSAQVAGRPFRVTKATSQLGCDVDALIAGFDAKTKLVVVGTPNNPTGSIVSKADLARILAALPSRALLVVDEAYAEYADAWPEVDHADGIALFRNDPRVVVLRTFSKIYGLAGIRVGYALGNAGVVGLLGKVTRTFNVNSLAQVAAIAALDDHDHLTRSQQLARRCIEQLIAASPSGCKVFPSLANFVIIDCGRPSGPLYDQLLRHGVIVRPMTAWGLPQHLRVSIAAEEQLPRVIATLRSVLGQS